MTSRRDLYAMGEPLGDGATRAKLGGGYVCGGGGDSSSSNTNQQFSTTNQYDQRQVFDQRQDNRSWTNNQTDARAFTTNTSTSTSLADVGNTTLSNSNNTTNNLQVLDAGAIKSGQSIALAGIENNSTNTKSLFAVADSLFSKTADALNANTKLAQSLAGGAQQAYADATAQGAGNKNLVYAGLAVVGLAAVTLMGKK